MAVVLSAHDVAPYSLPIECLSFRPTPDVIIRKFNNKDSERSIHAYVPLRSQEEKLLREFSEYCRKERIQFSDYMVTKRTRYLSRTRGNVAVAAAKMRETQEWRNTVLAEPLRDDEPELAKMLQLGIVYFGGRDKCLRPFLVLVPKRIPLEMYKKGNFDILLRVLIFIMEYLQKYMLVPGRVESVSLLIDFAGLTLTQLPVNALKKVVGVLSSHYIGRMYQIFVANAPMFVTMVYSVVKNFITDRQQQKILFVHGDFSALKKLFLPEQLEKRYGGLRDDLQAPFYPFKFSPGPFSEDCKMERECDCLDAHVILSQQMVLGGHLWESQEMECPQMIFSCETARQREILSMTNLLTTEVSEQKELLFQRTYSELSMAKVCSISSYASVDPAETQNAELGIGADSDQTKDINSPSTIATETNCQNSLDVISTVVEIGSFGSGRSPPETLWSGDAQLESYGIDSTTIGSDKHPLSKSVGDTTSNVTLLELASATDHRKAAGEHIPVLISEVEGSYLPPAIEVLEVVVDNKPSPRVEISEVRSRWMFCC